MVLWDGFAWAFTHLELAVLRRERGAEQTLGLARCGQSHGVFVLLGTELDAYRKPSFPQLHFLW